MECLHCQQNAKYYCGQCLKAAVCGAECHEANWEAHKSVCQPFYFIAGNGVKRKRDDGASDYELAGEFRRAIEEGQAPATVLDLYNQMSDEYQKRYRRLFNEYFPRHNEFDMISREDFDKMPPDNILYLMNGTVRWGYEVDQLFLLLRDNPQARNPVTNLDFSDEQQALIVEAVEKRRQALFERVYKDKEPAGSFEILVRVYRISWSELDWSRIRFYLIPPKYLVEVFPSLAVVAVLMTRYDSFRAYLMFSRTFWAWLFRRLYPDERHEDETEDLIKLGFERLVAAATQIRFENVLNRGDASFAELFALLQYVNQNTDSTLLTRLIKAIRDAPIPADMDAIIDTVDPSQPLRTYTLSIYMLHHRNLIRGDNADTIIQYLETIKERYGQALIDGGLAHIKALVDSGLAPALVLKRQYEDDEVVEIERMPGDTVYDSYVRDFMYYFADNDEEYFDPWYTMDATLSVPNEPEDRRVIHEARVFPFDRASLDRIQSGEIMLYASATYLQPYRDSIYVSFYSYDVRTSAATMNATETALHLNSSQRRDQYASRFVLSANFRRLLELRGHSHFDVHIDWPDQQTTQQLNIDYVGQIVFEDILRELESRYQDFYQFANSEHRWNVNVYFRKD